jgi:hypothetical protein
MSDVEADLQVHQDVEADLQVRQDVEADLQVRLSGVPAVAKKNTSQSNSPSRAPRSRASQPSPPRQSAAPIETASDMSTHATGVNAEPATPDSPSYDEIAEAAYHRYLRRGGQNGGDFDDWVEAERELRGRRSR